MEKTDPAVADPNITDRPDAERVVELVAKSPPTNYDLITDPGTGKSTLVYRLARRLPGVVYVTVPTAECRTGSADRAFSFCAHLGGGLRLGAQVFVVACNIQQGHHNIRSR